jgi:nucleoside-diphosphate-sugar epimerase
MEHKVPMNVLVTGGSGYLGSAVVDRLLAEGHDVTVYDNLLCQYTGTESATGRNAAVIDGPVREDALKVPVIEGDVTDEKAMAKTFEGRDAVIHLAAIVGENACNVSRDYAIKVNFLATRNIARICDRKKVRLIFASTASVYGARPKSMLNESSEVSPDSVYAITKLAAEESLRSNSTENLIFRLGTLFGASRRMRFDLVINGFVARALSKEPLTVFGGSQYRPLLHVRDAADAFLKALETEEIGLYNLGGNNYQIVDAANQIAQKLNARIDIFRELADPRDYCIDSGLAIKTLNVRFNETVEHAIEEIAEVASRVDYKNAKYSNEALVRLKLRVQ